MRILAQVIRALKEHDQEKAIRLLRVPIDINSTFGDRWSILHYAVFYGDCKILGILLDRSDIDVNPLTTCGTTPLDLAIKRNSSKMVIQLRMAGCQRRLPLQCDEMALTDEAKHLLGSNWSVVWCPKLHYRFLYHERRIAVEVLRANYAAAFNKEISESYFWTFFSATRTKQKWIYLPMHIVYHIIEYTLWLG